MEIILKVSYVEIENLDMYFSKFEKQLDSLTEESTKAFNIKKSDDTILVESGDEGILSVVINPSSFFMVYPDYCSNREYIDNIHQKFIDAFLDSFQIGDLESFGIQAANKIVLEKCPIVSEVKETFEKRLNALKEKFDETIPSPKFVLQSSSYSDKKKCKIHTIIVFGIDNPEVIFQMEYDNGISGYNALFDIESTYEIANAVLSQF